MSVIVGVDDTVVGRLAVERGIEEARLRDVPLVLIHAAHVGLQTDDPHALLRARQALEAFGEHARASGMTCRTEQVLSGATPGRVLVEEAARRDAQLLVIGGTKRTRVGKLLFGSTTQEVLLSADCAVLTLPAPREPGA